MVATEKIRVQVGFGVPTVDDLVLNFHFVGSEKEWCVTVTYKQICQLDSLINLECDKIKHVAFPIITKARMSEVIGLFKIQDFQLKVWHKIDRIRKMMEVWCFHVILRAHVMPADVYDAVEQFFLLPHGPIDPGDPIKEMKSGDGPQVQRRSSLSQSLGKLMKGDEKVEEDLEALEQREKKIEKSQQPLLKISVKRGRVGKRGKLEYEVITMSSKRF